MSFSNVFFAIICWLCSLIFGIISLWAFKRKDPMHFWSGSTVKPEEIMDIASYNRANGFMWLIYTFFMVATGVLSLFSIKIGAILLGIISVPGVFALVLVYNLIYKKYRSETPTNKSVAFDSKIPKTVIITITSITAIILVSVAAMFFYGEKDPNTNILDSHIQIKAMYGVSIGFSEITDISLIEKSMSDIGVGERTNGYGGVGKALKGNFKSDTLGETLLFVNSKSSPTIRIKRIGKKDVYLSLSDSESTENLYKDLIATIPLK